MEIFALLVFIIAVILFLFAGPHSGSDFSGGGRSDYNVGDNKAIVPAPLPGTKSRKRRWRRKRFAEIEKSAMKKTSETDSESKAEPNE